MRISEICIDRPVLASVMSIIIVLFGLISLTRLQNRELPDIDPPVVSVTTVFPGAAPEVTCHCLPSTIMCGGSAASDSPPAARGGSTSFDAAMTGDGPDACPQPGNRSASPSKI